MFWQIFFITVFILAVIYLMFARRVVKVEAPVFFLTILGVIVGLAIGALISVPLGRLGGPYGQWLPLVVNVFVVALVVNVFFNQRETIFRFSEKLLTFFSSIIREDRRTFLEPRANVPDIVIDTSVLIDGRLLELVRTGFLSGKLIIPKFVLSELQGIADSEETLRRNKGRRGLNIINELKREPYIDVSVVEDDFPHETDVDSKIIQLAKKYHAKLMTVDYNLNRVAQIQNVLVLNINELNNALRPVVLPGEKMKIKIVQVGKDKDQGVGYLEDGTMVVVERGADFIGQEKEVVITRALQTVAGKMIFALPAEVAAENQNNRTRSR